MPLLTQTYINCIPRYKKSCRVRSWQCLFTVTSVSSDWIQLQDAVKTPEICTCCFHNEETLKSCSKQEKKIVIGTGSQLNQTFCCPHVHKWMNVSKFAWLFSVFTVWNLITQEHFFSTAELMSDYSWQSTIVYKISSNAIRRAIMPSIIIIIKRAAGNLADLLVWGIVHVFSTSHPILHAVSEKLQACNPQCQILKV